jgi:hypothetical protein
VYRSFRYSGLHELSREAEIGRIEKGLRMSQAVRRNLKSEASAFRLPPSLHPRDAAPDPLTASESTTTGNGCEQSGLPVVEVGDSEAGTRRCPEAPAVGSAPGRGQRHCEGPYSESPSSPSGTTRVVPPAASPSSTVTVTSPAPALAPAVVSTGMVPRAFATATASGLDFARKLRVGWSPRAGRGQKG